MKNYEAIEETQMNQLNLQQGDFVVLKDGSIYQILSNELAYRTGLSLFNNQYSCLSHLDDYKNFDCIGTHHFNIYAVIGQDIEPEDYEKVGHWFISGKRLSKSEMESIQWDWKRKEDRPEFEKTNLENGLVVTTRDMNTYMTVLNIRRRGVCVDTIISQNEAIELSNYNEDLTHKKISEKDIIRVEIFNDFNKPEDRYLIWQR